MAWIGSAIPACASIRLRAGRRAIWTPLTHGRAWGFPGVVPPSQTRRGVGARTSLRPAAFSGHRGRDRMLPCSDATRAVLHRGLAPGQAAHRLLTAR